MISTFGRIGGVQTETESAHDSTTVPNGFCIVMARSRVPQGLFHPGSCNARAANRASKPDGKHSASVVGTTASRCAVQPTRHVDETGYGFRPVCAGAVQDHFCARFWDMLPGSEQALQRLEAEFLRQQRRWFES
jgi:hypothetical protein